MALMLALHFVSWTSSSLAFVQDAACNLDADESPPLRGSMRVPSGDLFDHDFTTGSISDAVSAAIAQSITVCHKNDDVNTAFVYPFSHSVVLLRNGEISGMTTRACVIIGTSPCDQNNHARPFALDMAITNAKSKFKDAMDHFDVEELDQIAKHVPVSVEDVDQAIVESATFWGARIDKDVGQVFVALVLDAGFIAHKRNIGGAIVAPAGQTSVSAVPFAITELIAKAQWEMLDSPHAIIEIQSSGNGIGLWVIACNNVESINTNDVRELHPLSAEEIAWNDARHDAEQRLSDLLLGDMHAWSEVFEDDRMCSDIAGLFAAHFTDTPVAEAARARQLNAVAEDDLGMRIRWMGWPESETNPVVVVAVRFQMSRVNGVDQSKLNVNNLVRKISDRLLLRMP